VWFLDSLGSTGWGLVLFVILFFRSEPYLLEYTTSRKRTTNLTTAILKQREEGTHGRRKEGRKERNSLYLKFLQCITSGNFKFVRYQKYEGWNFNSGNYLFTTDTK